MGGKLREGRQLVKWWEEQSPAVDKGGPFHGAPVSHFAARPGWVALEMSPRLSGPRSLSGPEAAGKARKPQAGRVKCLIHSLPAPQPQGHREMSFLQLLGAEVTPAQQITPKVEQRPASLLGPGLGSMGRGSGSGRLAAPA